MDAIIRYKLVAGIVSSVLLFGGFLIGYLLPLIDVLLANVLALSMIPFLILLNYILIYFLGQKTMDIGLERTLLIWLCLALNFLFAFVIGFTIPLLESPSRNNLGWVMMPLLFLLNFIIVDRYHYYVKHPEQREVGENEE